jgi:hypothetical protein
MALAYLDYQRSANDRHYFVADIGTNAFFQIKIGKQKRRYQGLELIDEEVFVSPILELKQARHALNSRFTLPVPQALFQDRASFIQLFSYRTPNQVGPALSAVLRVNQPTADLSDFLPNLALSNTKAAVEPYHVRNKAFTYQEPGISESMFWGQLLNALPGIVEKAVPVISRLVGGGRSSGGGSSAGGASSSTNELVNAIAQLIQNLTGNQGDGTASSPATGGGSASAGGDTATAEAPAAAASVSYYGLSQSLAQVACRTISPDTLDIIQDQPQQLGKVVNDSLLRLGGKPRAHYQYAEAQVAWAPIIAAVAPLVKDILQMGGQDQADQRRHLERLVELLNDPSLTALMAAMSTEPAGRAFTPDDRIYIDTNHLPKISLQQKERVVYRHGQALTIPFQLATDHPHPPARPIPRLIVEVTIQDPDTMAVLWQKDFRLKDVFLNSPITTVSILPEESVNLPVNQDLKVEITALWRGKNQGKVYGTVKNQFITLVKAAIFDRIGEKVGASIPLNDIVQHRTFWHKVWQGGYTDSRRWNIDFDAKYYYALELTEKEPARLETRIKILEDNAQAGQNVPDRRRVRAKLKAGMELTLEILNQLLPEQGYPALSADELEGLKSAGFQTYLNQTARAHLEFRGRSGDTGTLWVYPELDIHQIQVLRVSQTNEHGQVLGVDQQTLHFPRPSLIHFIGTQSE